MAAILNLAGFSQSRGHNEIVAPRTTSQHCLVLLRNVPSKQTGLGRSDTKQSKRCANVAELNGGLVKFAYHFYSIHTELSQNIKTIIYV